MTVVWLHGQLGFSSEEHYEWSRNWFRMAIEHYIEIGAAIAILIPALLQKTEIPFFLSVAAAYSFDLVLEALYAFESRKRIDLRRNREVAISWIQIDAVAVLLLGLIVFLRLRSTFISETIAATLALTMVVVLALWDYSRNRDLYFGLPRRS